MEERRKGGLGPKTKGAARRDGRAAARALVSGDRVSSRVYPRRSHIRFLVSGFRSFRAMLIDRNR